MGIYISIENIGESVQGSSPFPAVAQSMFSSEDLTSNLIGFHRGVRERRSGSAPTNVAYTDEANEALKERNIKLNNESQEYFMRVCGVVGYEEFYKQDKIAEFIQLQKDIHLDAFGFLGLSAFSLPKHKIWGTPPPNQWTGTVEERSTCQKFRCNESRSLPAELTSITPRPPLDGWAWGPGVQAYHSPVAIPNIGITPVFPDITSDPTRASGSMLFLDPSTSKFFGGHYYNTIALNWGG